MNFESTIKGPSPEQIKEELVTSVTWDQIEHPKGSEDLNKLAGLLGSDILELGNRIKSHDVGKKDIALLEELKEKLERVYFISEEADYN